MTPEELAVAIEREATAEAWGLVAMTLTDAGETLTEAETEMVEVGISAGYAATLLALMRRDLLPGKGSL